MTDKKIIALLNSSPEEGLRECVLRYSAYVLSICRMRLSGSMTDGDIEETVSDVFFSFYQSGLKNGFDIKNLRGLLSVIAARRCTERLRNKYRRPETVSIEELDTPLSVEQDFGEGDPELAQALHSLGQPREEIFIRKYFFGQKSSEIARDLNMKQNTVDKHISRGLERLREILREG